jgi:hypothetical protein
VLNWVGLSAGRGAGRGDGADATVFWGRRWSGEAVG